MDLDQTLHDPKRSSASAPGRSPSGPPDVIGRYGVTGVLGKGGMGIVYAAFDPELDRKVAIKVWHSERGAGSDEETHDRLLREAQALARLAHPNVVAVHDVGVFGGGVYVAMEFVDGETLRAWLERPRPWRAVVDVFLQAGRGLQAAHAAGLVHRDFKPENVMVSRDGRVRVMDFGLARAPSSADDPAPRVMTATTDSSLLSAQITRVGATVGTALYMAPEQHEGRPADARSDLFAFSVALYEGLYGEVPFAGTTLAVYAANVLRGAIRPPPRATKVPMWLRRVVLRGLTVAPADRPRSMEALLTDLGRDRSRQRRRALLLGTGLAGALGLGALLASDGESCEPDDGRWAPLLEGDARATLTAAFGRSGDPEGEASAARFLANLDRHRDAWSAMRRDACEATRRRGEQSVELLDLRFACLDHAQREVAALVRQVAAGVDRDAAEAALEGSYRLPDLEACAAAPSLIAAPRPPDDPALRERLDAAYERLADVDARITLGRYGDAEAALGPVLEDMRAIGHAPAIIAAQHSLANLTAESGRLEEALTHVREASRAAAEASDYGALAGLWVTQTTILGRLARVDAALERADAADDAIRLADAPLTAALDLTNARALIARSRGDLAGAKALFQEALTRGLPVLGADHPTIGKLEGNLGSTLGALGEYAEAEAALDRALASTRATLGPRHPRVAHFLLSRSRTAMTRADYAAADAALAEALEIRRERLGPRHPDVALVLGTRAGIRIQEGDRVGARADFEEALSIQEAALPADHPDLAINVGGLGVLALGDRRYDEARAHFERAIEISDHAYGPESENSVGFRLNLATVELHLDQPEAARRHFAECLAVWERTLGPDHLMLTEPLQGLGDAALASGDAAAALEAAQRVRALVDPHPQRRWAQASARLLEARALFQLGRDTPRVLALLDEAAALEIAEPEGASQIAEKVDRLRAQVAGKRRAGPPRPR